MGRRGTAATSAWVAAALTGWSPAAWADIEVNGTPYATLAEAVSAAGTGDTLVFDGATYTTGGVTIVSKSLTFEGNGSTIEGVGAVAGSIQVVNGSLTASNLTFTGRDGRAINMSAGTLRLTDATIETVTTLDGGGIIALGTLIELNRVLFDHTSATGDAGALYIAVGAGPATLTDVTFDGTSSGGDGGAIFADGADLTCDGCVFLGTTADNGGAIYADDSVLTVVDSRFEACRSGGTGGAVHTHALLDVDSSTFCNTSSATDGGAVNSNAGGGSFHNVVFLDTTSGASQDGSVARLVGGTWVFHQNHVVSSSGGNNAVFFSGATADVLGNVFLGNAGTAVTRSGGSFTGGGPRYDAFFGNGALVSGGGSATNHVTVDPQLAGFLDDGLCGNDALWPGLGSPLIDASDPATFDPDGSRADIGAFGGADSDPSIHGDADGDSFTFLFDCDDDEPDAFPRDPQDDGCDGIDNDCNGAVDDFVGNHPTWLEDCDDDGQGAASTTATQCDPPNTSCGWLPDDQSGGDDCDDARDDVFVGADEYCFATDFDCDGVAGIDGLGAVDAVVFYEDADGDGFGDAAREVLACRALDGLAATADDCDDTDRDVSPADLDQCGDGQDQDCSGLDGPLAEARSFWPDRDGDGYGDRSAAPVESCEPPAGWVADDSDCDDDPAFGRAIHPTAVEVCDGVDQDCDDVVDDLDGAPLTTYYGDGDGDGWGDASVTVVGACGEPPGFVDRAGDCDDGAPSVNPGVDEVCNTLDDDCDGAVDAADDSVTDAVLAWGDHDGDGFGACADDGCEGSVRCELGPAAGVDWVGNADDCDDDDGRVNPAASEAAGNGIDEDCDGAAAREAEVGGCGCDQSGAAPAAAALLSALVFRRARGRQRPDRAESASSGAGGAARLAGSPAIDVWHRRIS